MTNWGGLLIVSPFYGWENWHAEKLNNLPHHTGRFDRRLLFPTGEARGKPGFLKLYSLMNPLDFDAVTEEAREGQVAENSVIVTKAIYW